LKFFLLSKTSHLPRVKKELFENFCDGILTTFVIVENEVEKVLTHPQQQQQLRRLEELYHFSQFNRI
jgi:hypothetical protein